MEERRLVYTPDLEKKPVCCPNKKALAIEITRAFIKE
jgi:hypothetical protein